MTMPLEVPHFKEGTYSERSLAFFDQSHEWGRGKQDDAEDWRLRTVTWQRNPYRYWVEHSGVETTGRFGRMYIRHKMFQVALMSRTRTDTGLRELERWYIVQSQGRDEQVLHLSHLVDSPEAEKESGELSRNVEFALMNGLYVPNAEDLAKLDAILEQGRLDGYEQFHFPK